MSRQAIIYFQDDLTDHANNGGSILQLFEDQVEAGHAVIVMQNPSNAPANVLAVLYTKAQVENCKRARANMQDWFSKLFQASPAQPPT